MSDWPSSVVPPGRVEPVPRRIRAVMCGETVVDTDRALYVWEAPNFPVWYLPVADVTPGTLVDEGHSVEGPFGPTRVHGLWAGGRHRAGVATVLGRALVPLLSETVRIAWSGVDAWFEEDEQVFVHPRNPYVRIDALRSTRTVRVELDGVVLAESRAPVMVFETGLPTRYYLDRSCVAFEHLTESTTVTACPYKGTTSTYWSALMDGTEYPDIAWSYDFPTRELLPIAGLVAFYNERCDIEVSGRRVERPPGGAA